MKDSKSMMSMYDVQYFNFVLTVLDFWMEFLKLSIIYLMSETLWLNLLMYNYKLIPDPGPLL